MMTAWLIGLILSLLGIYLLKGSRLAPKRNWSGNIIEPERPVLKVWSTFLFILGALLPVFNIFMGIVMMVYWATSVYGTGNWICKENSFENKVVQLLNKPIK